MLCNSPLTPPTQCQPFPPLKLGNIFLNSPHPTQPQTHTHKKILPRPQREMLRGKFIPGALKCSGTLLSRSSGCSFRLYKTVPSSGWRGKGGDHPDGRVLSRSARAPPEQRSAPLATTFLSLFCCCFKKDFCGGRGLYKVRRG